MIRVEFKGIDKVRNYYEKLPMKLDKAISTENELFMKNVLKVAKEIVPVDTGALKESIKLEPVRKGKNVKKWKIVVNEPYGHFQEYGFSPHSTFVHASAKYPSKTPGYWNVKKWTPFIKPAVLAAKPSYLNALKLASKRAIAN